jgi:hypothetical protein
MVLEYYQPLSHIPMILKMSLTLILDCRVLLISGKMIDAIQVFLLIIF